MKMLSQTRFGASVDKESLRATIDLLMREELEKLRDEMRKCDTVTKIEIPRFGGDDVRAWLFKSEQFFKVNNIPDENKVNLVSIHLCGIALKWYKQLQSIIRGNLSWVNYKEAILQRFGNVQKRQYSCNSVKSSSFCLNFDDDLEDYVVYDGYYQVKDEKDYSAHKMFDEMPIKKFFKEGVKEASYMAENNIGDMVLDEVTKECDKVQEFEFKDSSKVDNGCFVGHDNFVEKVDKNIEISSLDHISLDLVETVRELVEVENVVANDKKVRDNTSDVLRSVDIEITKSRLEQLTGYGINDMKGQVGDLRKYVDRLLRVKDALLLRLHGSLICLVISSCGHEKAHKAQIEGGFIKVFDPGGKLVGDSRGSSDENVLYKRVMETIVVVTLYVLVEKSLLRSKEYEFEGVGDLFDNVVFIRIVDNFDTRKIQMGNSVMDPLVQILTDRKYLGCPCYFRTFSRKMEFGNVGSSVIDIDVGTIGLSYVGFEFMAFKMKRIVESILHQLIIGKFDQGRKQGFCLRNDAWPMEHGVNCIVVEYVQSISQLVFHIQFKVHQYLVTLANMERVETNQMLMIHLWVLLMLVLELIFYDLLQPLCVKDSQTPTQFELHYTKCNNGIATGISNKRVCCFWSVWKKRRMMEGIE